MSGKWQLVVSSDSPLQVMSLLSSPSGHLTNLSTAPDSRVMPGETAAEAFAEYISGARRAVEVHRPATWREESRGPPGCSSCPASTPDHEAHNLGVFEDFLAKQEDGADYMF